MPINQQKPIEMTLHNNNILLDHCLSEWLHCQRESTMEHSPKWAPEAPEFHTQPCHSYYWAIASQATQALKCPKKWHNVCYIVVYWIGSTIKGKDIKRQRSLQSAPEIPELHSIKSLPIISSHCPSSTKFKKTDYNNYSAIPALPACEQLYCQKGSDNKATCRHPVHPLGSWNQYLTHIQLTITFFLV